MTESNGETQKRKLMMVSSDGHAGAEMADYRPYLPSEHHADFDAFCRVYRERGSRNFETSALRLRVDPETVEVWDRDILQTGRHRGLFDIEARLAEMGRQGVAAEVLFPDFGLPYELYSPALARAYGFIRTHEQVEVGNRAYNRWLVDFCSTAPERFAGLASIRFDDIDRALKEVRWARDSGLRGVVMPTFSEEWPVFHQRYYPIWSLLQELEMPVNSHISLSGIAEYAPKVPEFPHPAVAIQVFGAGLAFSCQQLLSHLIWGGVLERFPHLQVVFTEQGSGWVVSELLKMDYSWEGSFFRRDIRELVPSKPSEYFYRQCHLGSSLFSLAEAKARHHIGVDKMTIGMDFPHHEGTWGVGPGHVAYLRATLGAADVTLEEAKMMLGANAVPLWGFDHEALQEIASQVGPEVQDVLRPPDVDHFPRGDVNKPLAAVF